MDAARPMEAMSDLIQSIKKTNWHTIFVLVPGLSFLVLTAKIYVDTSQSRMESVLTERIESVKGSQASSEDMIKSLRSEVMEMMRLMSIGCGRSELNGIQRMEDGLMIRIP